MSTWETLSKIDCKPNSKQKGKLSYLSWTWAWAEIMRKYPAASYEFEPPVFFGDGSCEVWVAVTIEDVTRKMWLPVMDNRNNSVLNPGSRQIGDCRMRCLTKCLAMFGLGHHIYAGEDIPDQDDNAVNTTAKQTKIVDYSALIAKYKSLDDAGQADAWNKMNPQQQHAVAEALK